MKLKMMNSLVGVERKGKSNKKSEGFLAMTEVADSLGTIRFLGTKYEGDLQIGDTVYYGTDRQQIRMQSMDIEVMEPSNIIAIVEEDDEGSSDI